VISRQAPVCPDALACDCTILQAFGPYTRGRKFGKVGVWQFVHCHFKHQNFPRILILFALRLLISHHLPSHAPPSTLSVSLPHCPTCNGRGTIMPPQRSRGAHQPGTVITLKTIRTSEVTEGRLVSARTLCERCARFAHHSRGVGRPPHPPGPRYCVATLLGY